jgi:hemerythrin-like domain-containing protein
MDSNPFLKNFIKTRIREENLPVKPLAKSQQSATVEPESDEVRRERIIKNKPKKKEVIEYFEKFAETLNASLD